MKVKKTITSLSLILILTLTIFNLLQVIPIAKADEGYVKIYILCLSDVNGWTFHNRSFNPSRVKDGIINAIMFKESTATPMAHPKNGKTPPYFDISYQVVTTWSYYESIVESYENVVVINTHGEIVPTPSDYASNPYEWIGKIAEAMLKRQVTWVHTAGYPFYYYWLQGASNMTKLGEVGFQHLMSHIGLNDVICRPPDYETVKIELSDDVRSNLQYGWDDFSQALKAERGKPLNGSDFKDYITLPIWGIREGYTTGAIVNFVKPSERFNLENWKGFGSYIHIGTDQTFNSNDQPTEAEYWRGYVAGAASVWAKTLDFNYVGVTKTYEYGGSYTSELAMTATPTICGYYKDSTAQKMEVCIGFSIYGVLKTNVGDQLSNVRFFAGNQPPDCQVIMLQNNSYSGHDEGMPTIKIYGLGKLGLKTLLFFYAIPPISAFLLFSDWLSFIVGEPQGMGIHGVNTYDSSILFEYTPETSNTYNGDYIHREFETFIYTRIQIDLTARSQWTVVPLDWTIDAWQTGSSIPTTFSGSLSVAIFNSYEATDYNATIFFEDFEDGMAGWSVGDTNSLAGYDYWNISTVGDAGAHCVYCAENGTNSIHGEVKNTEIWTYDKYMNAYLTLPQLDFRPYKDNLTLYYDTFHI